MSIYYQCDVKATTTPDRNKKAGQTIYRLTCSNKLVGLTGFEPATP